MAEHNVPPSDEVIREGMVRKLAETEHGKNEPHMHPIKDSVNPEAQIKTEEITKPEAKLPEFNQSFLDRIRVLGYVAVSKMMLWKKRRPDNLNEDDNDR